MYKGSLFEGKKFWKIFFTFLWENFIQNFKKIVVGKWEIIVALLIVRSDEKYLWFSVN